MGSALGLTSLARRVDVGLSGVKPVVAEAIGLLVTFVATTAAALAVLAVAAHAVPGWSSTIVSSGSMTPLIRQGDVVVFSRPDVRDVDVGSVVVFARDDGVQVVHRVVGIDADGSLTTRGDANATPDAGSVPLERVRGRGFVLIPWVGSPRVWWMRRQYGPIAAVGAVLLVGAAANRRSSRRARSSRPERRSSPVRWLLDVPPAGSGLLDDDSRSQIVRAARTLP